MAHGLPALPRAGAPAQAQVIEFKGLNYGTVGGAGELSDCRNLSAREYPCLSQRPGRKTVEGYDGCTAVYEHFGKLIVCAGGKLYVDGKELCQVSDEPKQFAVVNSQLVVWPDGILVSLTGERVLQDCEAVVTADDVSTVYDGSSIKADRYIPVIVGGDWVVSWRNGQEPIVYTYGKDQQKLVDCWNGTAWDDEKLKELEKETPVSELNGEHLITNTNGFFVTGTQNSKPDKSGYDTTGLYARAYVKSAIISATSTATVSITRFRAGMENDYIHARFAVGDRVDVSGGPYGLVGVERAQIKELNAAINKMTFSDADVIRQPVLYCPQEVGYVRAGGKVYLLKTYKQSGKTYEQCYEITVDEDIPEGCIVFGTVNESSKIQVDTYDWLPNLVQFWHPEKKEVYGSYAARGVKKEQMPEEYLTMELYPETHALTITRSMPKLDYICAVDNRLWGVSNEDKTIWSSEQGKPFSFYTYDGLSTDSYAVPVGSDGEFTGCCEIADNVAFFKEDRIHLLVGKEPEDYALYDYQYRGVAKGSCASMTVINERLFYLGTDGVYVFSASGSPQLISTAFGQRRFQNAVGGTDGRNYYISMQDKHSGEWGIWVFDTATGAWLQEDETQSVSFTNVSETVYMVSAEGKLQILHAEDSEEKVPWSATFCSIDETIHNRKCYSGLLLRYEADEGSSIKAEISCDGGPWREVKNVRAEGHKTSILPIRPNRCDSFQLRISGEGRVRLRSLVRKVTTGGLL